MEDRKEMDLRNKAVRKMVIRRRNQRKPRY